MFKIISVWRVSIFFYIEIIFIIIIIMELINNNNNKKTRKTVDIIIDLFSLVGGTFFMFLISFTPQGVKRECHLSFLGISRNSILSISAATRQNNQWWVHVGHEWRLHGPACLPAQPTFLAVASIHISLEIILMGTNK